MSRPHRALRTWSALATAALLAALVDWTPSASAYDRAGNAGSTTSRTEQGGSDKEF